MNRQWTFMVAFLSALCGTLIAAEATKVSDPRPNESAYVEEEFGACTFGKGKDRTRYIQPYLTCRSGIESFSLIPQEDGNWALLISPGDETKRSEEEARSLMLAVTIKVDDNDPHEFSMIWSRKLRGVALASLGVFEIVPLLDELRTGDSLTVSRNDEVIEFNVSRANQAIPELLFEQLIGLTKVEKTDT